MSMTTLIDRVKVARETCDDLLLDNYNKFVGWMDVYPGCQIEIEWMDEPGEEGDFPPLVDRGYIFLLPGQVEPHDTDAIFTEGIVHVPTPAGVEKEANEPEWILLVDLLANSRVEYIRLV